LSKYIEEQTQKISSIGQMKDKLYEELQTLKKEA
jgi:hypothetical protein